jgi:hypothetical protein
MAMDHPATLLTAAMGYQPAERLALALPQVLEASPQPQHDMLLLRQHSSQD